MKVVISISVVIIISVFFSLTQAEDKTTEEAEFAILLKAKATVLGPEVTLGEIGNIKVTDPEIQTRLLAIKVATAPPPGESLEISMSQIKRKLKSAGLNKYVGLIKGPDSIRVMTVQVELDKAFVQEDFA